MKLTPFSGFNPSPVLTHARSQARVSLTPLPDQFTKSPVSIKFGGCVCPVCLSIGLIENAHAQVESILNGDTIKAGSIMGELERQTGYNFIAHDEATRLLNPIAADKTRIQVSVMDRSDTPQGAVVKLPQPGQDAQFKTTLDAFANSTAAKANYPAYPKSQSQLPVLDPSLELPNDWASAQKPVLLSIVHQTYKEDQLPNTTPYSMGYLLANVVSTGSQKELLIMASREYPTFERMDIAGAGVMNALVLAATGQLERGPKATPVEAVLIAVPSDQPDLARYVDHLKALNIGVSVLKDDPSGKAESADVIPGTVAQTLSELYLRQTVPVPYSVVRVPLKTLKNWVQAGLPAPVYQQLLKGDATLAERQIPLGKALNAQQLMSVLRVPPVPGAHVFDSKHHEDGHDHDGHHHDDHHGHSHGPGEACGHPPVTSPLVTGPRIGPAPQPGKITPPWVKKPG
ncbi:MAG: hypothetical protein K2X01_04090 [Cyanobacteria bacterium]|nr:hypothetical protein [Cyanobacteriota bacterium]